MGRKLWVVLVLAAGVVLAAPNRLRESRASFAPHTQEQSAPTVQELQCPQQSVLPQTLDGGLVAEELMEYEGPYVEDGTNEPVSAVAALMLYNSGSRDISSGMVAVTQGERVLYFFVTWLPAGERALVLEYRRAGYCRDAVTGCRSLGLRWENFYPAEESVCVMEGGSTLCVENRSAQTVEGICLRYKTYIKEGDFYLGGITYSAYVGTLNSGKNREVKPSHYAIDAAKVVAVLIG